MVTHVLDSIAILRYLDGEAGSDQIAGIIKGHLGGRCRAIISAVHWGEIAGITGKVRGQQMVDLVLTRLFSFGLEIIPATAEHAVRAALIKLNRRIPNADAFGAELASPTPDHVFVTADFDLRPADRDTKMQLLPKK